MMKRFTIVLFACVALAVAGIALFGHTPMALAQTGGTGGLTAGLDAVGATVNLPASDPRVIAVRVINVALGVLGFLMVILILYAGFLYMTAGGDAAKVQKAIAYIRNAIIGLIIILLSWAIARYVITRLMEATGVGGGGGTTTPGGGGGFGGGGGSAQFRIISITPSGSVDTRKVIVKIVFTSPVDPESAQAAGAITVERVSDGVAIAGTVEVVGSAVRFRPNASCPAPNQDRFCFDENTEFRVRVSPTLRSTADQAVACGGFAPDCEGRFRTGSAVDVTPPQIYMTYPLNGFSVSADALVDVSAFIRDETAVSYVSFTDNGNPIGDSAPTGDSPRQFDAHVQWDTAGIAPGSIRELSATGYDVDSGSATANPVSVVIRPSHCFDGVRNEGETGVDCGGDPASADSCGACSNAECTNGTQCASGVCTNGFCVEQPIITGVDPLDGAPGSFVTIRGSNFGTNGSVTFLGSTTPVEAFAPLSCAESGVSSWSPREVIVAVPAGAQTGPIRLTNAVSDLSDATNAEPPPAIGDFVVNDTLRPGLCAAVPNVGQPGTVFSLIGSGFGSTAGGVQFGERTLATASWTDEQIGSSIPNAEVGTYPVFVRVDGVSSNIIGMRVTRADAGGSPEIVEISPAQGPIGAFVTILGRNFGSSAGSVYFLDTQTGNSALADTNVPDACVDGSWTNNSIVVKVPRAFTQGSTGALVPGSYAVYVRTARATAPESNRVNFAVNTDPLAPGICSIVPRVAPIGSSITVHGENLTSGPGTVVYHVNVVGTASSWSGSQIVSRIPSGAETGPVRARLTASGLSSNPYPIEVRNCNEAAGVCESDEECCTDGSCRAIGSCAASAGTAIFAWRFSTGVVPRAPRVLEQCDDGTIPSPSPWSQRPEGREACVNSVPVMAFSTQIDPGSVANGSGNVIVERCTGTGSDPCEQTETVAGNVHLYHANATQDYVTVNVGILQPSSWYRVSLTTGVRGAGEGGLNMEENRQCGEGMAYCYRFRTRESTEPCEIATVSVAPNPFTAHEQNESVEYAALPTPEGDRCSILICEEYGWSWQTSDSRAMITHAPNPEGVGESCYQVATALAETGPSNPVQILTTAQAVTGAGDLYIRFIPPRITSYGPNCDGACSNAAIWASFNVPLDPESVRMDNIRIERCANEACQELLEPPTLDLSQSVISLRSIPDTSGSEGRFLVLEPVRIINGQPATLLEPGRYYRVILRGGQENGITSASNVPMSSLNHPDGFSWTFRVLQGEDAMCASQRISVSPGEKYEDRVGDRQGFFAAPVSGPDSCDSRGQLLVSSLLGGFSWNVADTRVARLLFNGAIDTGTVRVNGCTDRCTLTGSQGTSGQTARCGNNIVETTNAATCVGSVTRSGQSCVVLPAGSTGGEECDGGSGCNSLCLFEPVPTIDEGGTCGDGVRQPNEDCDYGRFCTGVSATSTVQEGSDCTSGAQRTACLQNGGRCATAQVRGCSVHCRNLGANAGGSTCGNGDVSDGEDCDDGNITSRDGCSANCLHEGSSSSIFALCGNRIREDGEACEMSATGAWPAGCDPRTCLHAGLSPCGGGVVSGCCGNAIIEDGEDCDDGNTTSRDGCSTMCLNEGSSPSYAEPSFCGDRRTGLGEFSQCEVAPSGPDGRVDAYQVAEVLGGGDVDEETKIASTNINVTQSGASGSARYGLRCGLTEERMCSENGVAPSRDFGLTHYGCCSMRPSVATFYPANGETDVCRNALIYGTFNMEVDESSITPNFIVAQRVTGTDCPEGMTEVALDGTPRKGWRFTLARWWNSLRRFFGAETAFAQIYCSGNVIGRMTFGEAIVNDGGIDRTVTTFEFSVTNVLAAETQYRVIFRGDSDLENNTDSTQRVGIRSLNGVVADGDTSWNFVTGREICLVNRVEVSDQTTEHPLFFTASNEIHPFRASAQSLRAGRYVPIASTAEYSWVWQNWTSSQSTIARIDPETSTDGSTSVSHRSVIAGSRNGSAYITARVRITEDAVSVPSTIGSVVQGATPVTVQVCENPWPSKVAAPFRDEENSPSLQGTPFERGPFYNISMSYCRDAGEPGVLGDIPSLVINAVNPNPVDTAQGILRQYLFTFAEPDFKKDAIGMRIAQNPLHLSPQEWYRAKGFTGNPTEITIDGYQAIRDGRTVYVSAVSTDGPGSRRPEMYSNIYILSYNDGASSVTQQIFDALLESLMFNRNIQTDISGACEDADGGIVSGPGDIPVYCSADWECSAYGSDLSCANFKSKIQRDLIRLGDFQAMTRTIEAAKLRAGSYPQLRQGSYLPGLSTSLWPSWSDALTTELGGSLPQDPINRFVTCGRCDGTGSACTSNADCSSGQTCLPQEGFDPKTCWNATANAFVCPVSFDGGSPSSRVYTYQSLDAGRRYEIAAEFEVPPPGDDPSEDWWQPPLMTEVRQCTNGAATGRYCFDDTHCTICPPTGCTGNEPTPRGACVPMGGRFTYANFCTGGTLGMSSVCGDGIMDVDPSRYRCFGGENDGRSCSGPSACPNGICTAAEICETTGPTSSRYVDCQTASGADGRARQVCDACRSYVSDPNNAMCRANNECGNGRIEGGHCSENPDVFCSTTAQCQNRYARELQEALNQLNFPVRVTAVYDAQTRSAVTAFQAANRVNPLDGIVGPITLAALRTALNCPTCIPSYAGHECTIEGVAEVCDDGVLNGTYGHCNTLCTGYEGGCGDGFLSGGEICDNGLVGSNANREWCAVSPSNCPSVDMSCNLSCSGRAGWCGDGITTAPFEECDGNVQTTNLAICADETPCEPGTTCSDGVACSAIQGRMAACEPQRICIGGQNDGRICTSEEYCSPDGRCSNERVRTIHRRTCTRFGPSACQFYVWSLCVSDQTCGNGVKDVGEQCDDGNDIETDSCTSACLNNVCGDGLLHDGVEECDMGVLNGTPCTSAEYGSTCSSCSTSCKYQLTQGGFCGDRIRQAASSEQCDGDATIADVQQYLGSVAANTDAACRALGYDYLSSDRVHCGQTCSFTGCAYCGDPPTIENADDPEFQGIVEGLLFDTLFQQPVPNARVTLFYRGLQVAVTASDDDGYFSFTGLDRHEGCGSYRIVIDSYVDNPLTTLLDESVRGGYMPVQVPSFAPHYNIANESGTSGLFSDVVVSADLAQLVSHPTQDYVIPQISMLPRLADKEYIVQLWWTPRITVETGSVNQTLQGTDEVLEFFRDAGTALRNEVYIDAVSELHDLVIRQPFAYAPGNFSSCRLGGSFGTYNPLSSDTRVNGRNPATGAAGVNGIDASDPVTGMQTCTNKVRASFSKTCAVRDLDGTILRHTNIGCSSYYMCMNHGIAYNYSTERLTCTSPPEGNRQGSPDVLSGREGAYLFCYHPEWIGIDDARARRVDCGNFIVPPQSAFIRATSGQYDILVSRYQLAYNALTLHRASSSDRTQNANSVRNWLTARDASIRIYDQYGLRETIDETTGGISRNSAAGWNPSDNAPRVCLAESERVGFSRPWEDYFSPNLIRLGETTYSPVWTPASIDGKVRSDQAVKVWGDRGADFHYFSDLAYRWTEDSRAPNPGQGICWERDCDSWTLTEGYCISANGSLSSTRCTSDSDCGTFNIGNTGPFPPAQGSRPVLTNTGETVIVPCSTILFEFEYPKYVPACLALQTWGARERCRYIVTYEDEILADEADVQFCLTTYPPGSETIYLGCYARFPRLSGYHFCQGGTADYAGYDAIENGNPACDDASRALCPDNSTCETQVNPNVRCVQACTTDADCDKPGGAYCGGVLQSCTRTAVPSTAGAR